MPSALATGRPRPVSQMMGPSSSTSREARSAACIERSACRALTAPPPSPRRLLGDGLAARLEAARGPLAQLAHQPNPRSAAELRARGRLARCYQGKPEGAADAGEQLRHAGRIDGDRVTDIDVRLGAATLA